MLNHNPIIVRVASVPPGKRGMAEQTIARFDIIDVQRIRSASSERSFHIGFRPRTFASAPPVTALTGGNFDQVKVITWKRIVQYINLCLFDTVYFIVARVSAVNDMHVGGHGDSL